MSDASSSREPPSGHRLVACQARATSRVRVLVVGGLSRLDAFYRSTTEADVVVDVLFVDGALLETRAEVADALVLVVGKISHSAAAKVRSISRQRGTPLVVTTGASVSRVRAAITEAHAAVRSGVREAG